MGLHLRIPIVEILLSILQQVLPCGDSNMLFFMFLYPQPEVCQLSLSCFSLPRLESSCLQQAQLPLNFSLHQVEIQVPLCQGHLQLPLLLQLPLR